MCLCVGCSVLRYDGDQKVISGFQREREREREGKTGRERERGESYALEGDCLSLQHHINATMLRDGEEEQEEQKKQKQKQEEREVVESRGCKNRG